MSKLTAICACPVDTFSGYGTMARSFLTALIKAKDSEWDIKVLSLRWGNTPFGALNQDNPGDADIIKRLINQEDIKEQPDVWIQISVSNEFARNGRVNIGYSCLVETDIVPGDMMEGLNRMDFNLLSSEHTKAIAEHTSWDKNDKDGNKIGTIVLEKPAEVLFLGLDTTKFKKPETVSFDLSSIPESFCFLTVGHIMAGTGHLEDRKMMGRLIRGFLEAFSGKKNKPALIMKCSTGGYSHMDEERTLREINNIVKTVGGNDLPKIYLIHGELSETELCELYSHDKVKAFALVGNEGFGLPYAEFSAVSSKPIIASCWSGHKDFLHIDYNLFVNGKVETIHPAAANQFLLKESSWFKPDIKSISDRLVEMHTNYPKYAELGKRQGYKTRTEFTVDKMAERLGEILDKHMPKISKPVTLSLPKLVNIKKPEITYLEEI